MNGKRKRKAKIHGRIDWDNKIEIQTRIEEKIIQK